ncbi:MAG: hypothetical protein NZ895_05245 [Archaeoglobaceae archaeon]|nr:hypothetical protein [Archaeoglobaceae archaeon]MCX8152791.1 hypothetical protein [Archaeoglobaceae archaeon]MDW8013498.1 hypothetical protein [Archaeoglobaceae archaeon]
MKVKEFLWRGCGLIDEKLRLDYDLQHFLILSKKNIRDHAVIRMIISTLCSEEELIHVSKKDFRRMRGKSEYYTVKFKNRLSPVDKKTFEIVQKLPDKPFEMDPRDVNEIVSKYSPPDRKYDAKKLKKAVETILRDAALYDVNFEKLSIEEKFEFMLDFNPIYSDVWDEDSEGFEEFIRNYAKVSKLSAEEISKEFGEDVEKVKKVLKKRSLLSFSEELV